MSVLDELLEKISQAGGDRNIVGLYFYQDGSVIVSFENDLDNPDDVQVVMSGNPEYINEHISAIAALRTQLADAEADADRLAKRVEAWNGWLVENDMSYSTRDGISLVDPTYDKNAQALAAYAARKAQS